MKKRNIVPRKTKQKEAILKSLVRAARPLRPDELLIRASEEIPELDITTVYRNIKRLLEDGTLAAVTVPGEPPRYELSGKTHHHHFLCRSCNRLFDIEGCPGNLQKLSPKGFKLEDHFITLIGLCKACG